MCAKNPGEEGAFEISPEIFTKTINTNVLGPVKLTETLLPYLERSRRPVVMNMSTGLASIGIDLGPKCAVYSASKTTLNMIVSYCVVVDRDLMTDNERTDIQAGKGEAGNNLFCCRSWLGEDRCDLSFLQTTIAFAKIRL